jgi:cob(I)alamin adenosyltransferase
LGLIHIYYGLGVGKTTRTVGLALRAAGCGILVDFVQFLKPGTSPEVAILKKIPNIRFWCPGKHPFIMSKGAQPVHFKHVEKAHNYILEAIENGSQLLICDEILDTILFGLLEKERLLDLMERCKGKVELMMTGRTAPTELIEKADYVTELVQIKHPYYSGAKARRGIEY